MNRSTLFLLAGLCLLSACQTRPYKERIADQEQQLEALQQERERLAAQGARVAAENQELQEAVDREVRRNQELQQQLQALEHEKSAVDAEAEALRTRLRGTGVEVSRRGGYLVLDLPQAITFPSGSADLSEQGKESLAAVAAALQADYADRNLWIEGHTDNDPIRKSSWASNLHLSVARALAVAEYLIQEQGIPDDRIRVAGHGPNMPKEPNDSPEGKAANRRVEILILD